MNAPLPFIDLASQQKRISHEIEAAIRRVLQHGRYIMGPEVAALEAALCQSSEATFAVSCASGTDALAMLLMAKNVRPGDAILCPSFTFAATAEVVAWLGATPVFVDVEPGTYNMGADAIGRGVSAARKLGLRPTGVISVDLFGRPCDYQTLLAAAEEAQLWVLADAAQSFGAQYHGRPVGTFGFATATSFFPAKPLGCYGDGGAIFTNDAELHEVLKSLRIHGQGLDKYDNVRIGMNGRLDTIQAAILLEKMNIFPEEIESRNSVARRYNNALSDIVDVPQIDDHFLSTWAQYTIAVRPHERASLINQLENKGVPTAIYYPRGLHQQPAYRHYPVAVDGLPVTEAICEQVLSLPMHPYLEPETQDFIVEAVRSSLQHIRSGGTVTN